VPGVAEAGTEHCGAFAGLGDTEHASVTVSVNPLTVIRSRVADAGELGATLAGVRVKAGTAKSGGVVSLNTVPMPLAPNVVTPYRLPAASSTNSPDARLSLPVKVNRTDSLPVESSLKTMPLDKP
jgi:hypothetical protein